MNHLEYSFTRKTQLRIPKKFINIEMDVAKARLTKEDEPKNTGVSFIAKLNTAILINIEKV
jgi:hypothetical protein